MKMEEFFGEFMVMLNKDFPELCVDEILHDRSCLTVGWALAYAKLSFAIDKAEWINNPTDTLRKSLIRSRVRDMLITQKEFIDVLITRCNQ